METDPTYPGPNPAPRRAHTLICSMGGDTAADLATELRNLASRIERDDITVGCCGGPTSGRIYSYRVAPEQTHDAYFAQVDAWLKQRAPE
jgi:hypothetical protein